MNNWKRNSILFLISQCITLFGSQIVQFAIVWFVTLKTGSGIWISLFSICAYLPQFFMSFIGGVWADKFNKKVLIIISDLGIALVTLLVFFFFPVIQNFENEQFLILTLLVMAFLRSVGSGIQTPTVNALLPELVPSKNLMRFNGINATMQSLVQFASPAVAGVVLTMSDIKSTLIIDIFTAIIGIAIFVFVKINRCDEEKKSSNIEVLANKNEFFNKQNSFLSELKLGLKYATTNTQIGSLLLTYALFIFLSVPSGYLSGLFITQNFGNTYWYLTAVELVGFGAMALGGILMSTWGGFKNKNKTLCLGFFIFGFIASVMGFSKNIYIYLILMSIFGVMLTVIQASITTMLQEKTESSMQGRVFGFMNSLYSFCYPLGMLIFGPIADFIQLTFLMLCSGFFLILISILILNKQKIKN